MTTFVLLLTCMQCWRYLLTETDPRKQCAWDESGCSQQTGGYGTTDRGAAEEGLHGAPLRFLLRDHQAPQHHACHRQEPPGPLQGVHFGEGEGWIPTGQTSCFKPSVGIRY